MFLGMKSAIWKGVKLFRYFMTSLNLPKLKVNQSVSDEVYYKSWTVSPPVDYWVSQ